MHQHEGRAGRFFRADGSQHSFDYCAISGETTLDREEMKHFNPTTILKKLNEVIYQVAKGQTRQMTKVAQESAESAGNVIDADGKLTPETYLDMFRQVEVDFDPRTLKLSPSFTIVMHPETAAWVMPKVKEWEKDPSFRSEYQRIIAMKREEWRGREANRKLVD